MSRNTDTAADFGMSDDSQAINETANKVALGKHLLPNSNEIEDGESFTPLPYMSNYVSVAAPLFINDFKSQIRSENEFLLKQYYSSKKSISHAMYRHGSIVSDSGSSNISEGSNPFIWMDKFLDASRYMLDIFESGISLDIVPSNGDAEEIEKKKWLKTHVAAPYFKQLQRLSVMDLRNPAVFRKHDLWIPTIKNGWRNELSDRNGENHLYDGKVCPLFIDGNEYMSKDYDMHEGSTSIPSIFSEYKLPSLVYHCAVELNGAVYILGGLMACHKYDDEAPSLKDFHINGVKNLPPPLLSSVVNNPSMINNGRLYVMSAYSNSLRRPELSGQIPPPLLCLKGSKLTERHIFFYGGFEIRTETNVREDGSLYLKKRAYVNNTGYILDTMTFNFTRVELTAVSYKLVSYPSLAGRFGHMQLSVPDNGNNHINHNNSSGYLNHQRHREFDENSNNSAAEGNSSEGVSRVASFGSPHTRLNNGLHSSGVYSILIFGGYKQVGDDDYGAMDDLWKIDVPVLVKGKRGYYKFASTANAVIIPKANPDDPWPSPRAFAADCFANIRDTANKPDLLERLQENYFIDKSTFSVSDKSGSLLKTLPYSRAEHDRPKVGARSKDSGASTVSSPAGSNATTSNPFLRQRLSSPPSGSSASTVLPPKFRSHPNEHKVLILHGGSDKTNVLHDMWWYDTESETWSQIATHGKHKDSKMISIELGLVGHSMVCVGGMAVFLGGLLQEDVDHLYSAVDYEHMKLPPQLAIGSDFINIFDLESQCLLGHTIIGDEKNARLLDDSHARLGIILSVGCSLIQFNGDILLFGGVVAKRLKSSDISLRGAVLKCILPSMKLAA